MGRIIVIGLGLALVGVGAAVKYLPWYGGLAVLAGLLVALWLFGGRLLHHLLTLPFKAKGRVLRGATLEIHAVAPLPPGDDQARFELELTLTPAAAQGGPFHHWQPGDLELCADGRSIEDRTDDGCAIDAVAIVTADGVVADDGASHPGPLRLRLACSAPPDARAVQLRYYFERLGRIELRLQEDDRR